MSDLVFTFCHTETVATNTEELVQIACGDGKLRLTLLEQQRLDDLAANLGNITFQRPHAGFARVVANDVAQSTFGNGQLGFLQTIGLHLFGQQITLRNVDLLVLGVAGETDHFHTIKQRRRNVQRIGGRHEHHFGEVVLNLDIVIDKSRVLLRVEHFQQSRTRVATKILSQLVDFVEQEERVLDCDLGHVLQNLARHRTNVRATVPANLGFIAYAAEAHANELSTGRVCNRLPE